MKVNHSAVLLLCLISVLSVISQAGSGPWTTINGENLCITEGAIEKASGGAVRVSVPKMRAYVAEETAPAAELRLTYLGPTSKDSALGSGVMRRQFGLKLRAQDACNLVYVMWRIDPEPKLVVSVKQNAGNTPARNAATAATGISNRSRQQRLLGSRQGSLTLCARK